MISRFHARDFYIHIFYARIAYTIYTGSRKLSRRKYICLATWDIYISILPSSFPCRKHLYEWVNICWGIYIFENRNAGVILFLIRREKKALYLITTMHARKLNFFNEKFNLFNLTLINLKFNLTCLPQKVVPRRIEGSHKYSIVI